MQDVCDDDQLITGVLGGCEALGGQAQKAYVRAVASIESPGLCADIDAGHGGTGKCLHNAFGDHSVAAADFEDCGRRTGVLVDRGDEISEVDEDAAVELGNEPLVPSEQTAY